MYILVPEVKGEKCQMKINALDIISNSETLQVGFLSATVKGESPS